MSDINSVIQKLFSERWCGHLADASLAEQRAQVYKTLKNQIDGYWSGHTAYNLVVDGGFLIDSKKGGKKKLTELGKIFYENYEGGV